MPDVDVVFDVSSIRISAHEIIKLVNERIRIIISYLESKNHDRNKKPYETKAIQ